MGTDYLFEKENISSYNQVGHLSLLHRCILVSGKADITSQYNVLSCPCFVAKEGSFFNETRQMVCTTMLFVIP